MFNVDVYFRAFEASVSQELFKVVRIFRFVIFHFSFEVAEYVKSDSRNPLVLKLVCNFCADL